MKTKEVIENRRDCIILFLKQLKIDNLPLDECCYDMKEKCCDIIDLLKRGKKFEEMFEEIIEANKVLKMCMDFDELKEKYFPKEVKQ